LVVAATLTAACADPDSEAAVVKPELRDCSANWTTLYEQAGDEQFAPQRVRWHEGTLYYQEGAAPHILQLPDMGGAPELLVDDDCLQLWVEGDQLLCARADRLFAVQLASGERSQLADGETFAKDVGRRGQLFGAYALDDAYLYWIVWETLKDGRPASVWRLARDGGGSEKLGEIADPQDLLEVLVILPEQLLAVGTYGHAYTLPKGGGEVEALPAVVDATRIGAAPSGALWSVEQVARGRPTQIVRLSRPTGAQAEPFWPDKRAEIEPGGAWSDTAGEWVVLAGEPFSDGRRHLSVWSVDATGHATRIGCAPDDTSSSQVAMAAVLTPEEVFLSVQRSSGWAFVKLMRHSH
jgi:hypothetical protein